MLFTKTMELRKGSKIAAGRFKIERVLGQGAFGITYLAVHTVLEETVAIKEFFMKGVCDRDGDTSQVTVSNAGNEELVSRYRENFLKEARNIYRLKHKNIITVTDVFEENGTAYYVMEYVGGISLADKVRDCAIPELVAVRYIRQVAAALDYVHSKRMMHLDVKPANILLDKDDNAVLIGFGLAKQYDSEGQQTNSIALGISHGYAPMEQYKHGGVSNFSPATDVYSLGATLFKLVTGITPPEASDVGNEGLPVLPGDISPAVRGAIEAAMQFRIKDRPQSIAEFLEILSGYEDSDNVNLEKKVSYKDATFVADDGVTHNSESDDTVKTATENHVYSIWIGLFVFLFFLIVAAVSTYSDYNDYETESDIQRISTLQKVDLGLSVYWAGWNVGATSPEGFGEYYEWADIAKSVKNSDGSFTVRMNRYSIAGNPSYDVATAEWGGSWRMPTEDEFIELINRCTWTWTCYNGVSGYKVTGLNGNGIFLPAAGMNYNATPDEEHANGNYWSATPDDDPYKARNLFFNINDYYPYNAYRAWALPVRPVCDK